MEFADFSASAVCASGDGVGIWKNIQHFRLVSVHRGMRYHLEADINGTSIWKLYNRPGVFRFYLDRCVSYIQLLLTKCSM